MLIFRNPFICYETPGGAPGGAPPAQPPTPQPTPVGQGQPQGQGDGFRSTFFPNVPDEHWGLIEPHVKNINQHVTQLQQRYAPFSSYTPEAVQGLARFAAAFDQDPVGQWLVMARAMQQQGTLDQDLDLDHLEGLIKGTVNAEPDGQPQLEGDDPRDQIIQQMAQRLEQLEGRWNQNEQSQRERVENAALKRTTGWMKEQLKAGGIDESLLSDQRLIAMFVGHGGNAQAAVNDALEYRTAILGGVVPEPKTRRRELDLPNGAPKVPAERKSNRSSNRRGMFANVSEGAEQYMARANQS